MFKTYLGDAVYVEYDGYSIVLTTNDGYGDTDIIVLEPVVREAFKNWLFLLYDTLAEHKNHLQSPAPEPVEEQPESAPDGGAVDQGV